MLSKLWPKFTILDKRSEWLRINIFYIKHISTRNAHTNLDLPHLQLWIEAAQVFFEKFHNSCLFFLLSCREHLLGVWLIIFGTLRALLRNLIGTLQDLFLDMWSTIITNYLIFVYFLYFALICDEHLLHMLEEFNFVYARRHVSIYSGLFILFAFGSSCTKTSQKLIPFLTSDFIWLVILWVEAIVFALFLYLIDAYHAICVL